MTPLSLRAIVLAPRTAQQGLSKPRSNKRAPTRPPVTTCMQRDALCSPCFLPEFVLRSRSWSSTTRQSRQRQRPQRRNKLSYRRDSARRQLINRNSCLTINLQGTSANNIHTLYHQKLQSICYISADDNIHVYHCFHAVCSESHNI